MKARKSKKKTILVILLCMIVLMIIGWWAFCVMFIASDRKLRFAISLKPWDGK